MSRGNIYRYMLFPNGIKQLGLFSNRPIFIIRTIPPCMLSTKA